MRVSILLIAVCAVSVNAHRLLENSPSPLQASWPPDLDVPLAATASEDLLAHGGAKKVLGRAKLQQIKDEAALGISVDALAAALESDHDLFLHTPSGRLLHKCTMPAPKLRSSSTTEQAVTSSGPRVEAAALILPDVFRLHSRPSARKKILLDFDGHIVTGTDWNQPGLEQISVPAWDTDKNPQSFSLTELGQIRAIWSKVAEDFAPFDVDVTTEDPGSAALLSIGHRVIIGGDSNVMPGFAGAGGTCFVGSFGSKEPCFIFQKSLYSDVKTVADAAAHEAGHALGLLHDGTASYEYYVGHANWAPIMGVGYTKNITQWARGEYAGANNHQDDFTVISNFLPLLPQEHGSSIASASRSLETGRASGVISQANQVDYHQFTAKAGPVRITAQGPGEITTASGRSYPLGNMDMQIILFDAAGNILASSNPEGASAQALGATITSTLSSSGTYYISVTGVGYGSPTGTGYTSYGSRGHYFLAVDYTKSDFIQKNNPVDCVGAWSAWSECTSSCQQMSTYRITSSAREGGRECDQDNGATRTRSCNTGACRQTPSPSPNPPADTREIKAPLVRMQRIATTKPGKFRCRASALILAVSGQRLPGAVVLGQWTFSDSTGSGTTATVAVTAKASAVVTSPSSVITSPHGSCRFEITDIRLNGFVYGASGQSAQGEIEW